MKSDNSNIDVANDIFQICTNLGHLNLNLFSTAYFTQIIKPLLDSINSLITIMQGNITTIDGEIDTLQTEYQTISNTISTINTTISAIETALNGKMDKTAITSSFDGVWSGQQSDYSQGWIDIPLGTNSETGELVKFTIQWGYPGLVAKPTGAQASGTITFPKPFQHVCLNVIGSDAGNQCMAFGFYNRTPTGCTWGTLNGVGTDGVQYSPSYYAFGL